MLMFIAGHDRRSAQPQQMEGEVIADSFAGTLGSRTPTADAVAHEQWFQARTMAEHLAEASLVVIKPLRICVHVASRCQHARSCHLIPDADGWHESLLRTAARHGARGSYVAPTSMITSKSFKTSGSRERTTSAP